MFGVLGIYNFEYSIKMCFSIESAVPLVGFVTCASTYSITKAIKSQRKQLDYIALTTYYGDIVSLFNFTENQAKIEVRTSNEFTSL